MTAFQIGLLDEIRQTIGNFPSGGITYGIDLPTSRTFFPLSGAVKRFAPVAIIGRAGWLHLEYD